MKKIKTPNIDVAENRADRKRFLAYVKGINSMTENTKAKTESRRKAARIGGKK